MTVVDRDILTANQDPARRVSVRRMGGPDRVVNESQWHVDDQSVLLAVLVASANATVLDRSQEIHDGELASGSVLLIPPGSAATVRFKGAFELIAITIKTSALQSPVESAPAEQNMRRSVAVVPRDALAEQLARSMASTSEECDEAYACAVANVIACRALRSPGMTGRAGQLPKWRLKRVQSLIESRIEDTLTLADLAAAADLSRMHFAAQFRATTGVRPHEYVLLKRVERSKALMLQTDEPLAQIALAAGFQAQSHFSTTFKRITGETPATWRRQSRTSNRIMVSTAQAQRPAAYLA